MSLLSLLEEQTLSMDNHPKSLLDCLDRFRYDVTLCDITLVTENQEFHAHKIVLSCCSAYFRAMFTIDMAEKHCMQVEIPQISPAGLDAILAFIYSGSLTIRPDIVEDILGTANYFQMDSALNLCCEYLKQAITSDNCWEILTLCQRYGLVSLKETINQYIIENFLEMTETDCLQYLTQELTLLNSVQFLNLSHRFKNDDIRKSVENFLFENFLVFLETESFLSLSVNQISHFLSSERLIIPPESEVVLFQRTLEWMVVDPSRAQHAVRLFTKIRFPIMSLEDLVEHVQGVDLMMENQECRLLFMEALKYHASPVKQSVMQSSCTQLRSKNEVLLAVISSETARYHSSVMYHSKRDRVWFELGETPLKSTVNHSVVTLGNFLHVVGGNIHYRYDPRFDIWHELPPMRESRLYFHLNALRGRLYAVGGRSKEGELSSVECYDPAKNKWRFVASLPDARAALSGAIHDDALYIAGGASQGTYKNTMYCYDPSTNQWQPKNNMPTPRAGHCMAMVTGRIFVIGGMRMSSGNCVSALNVECYIPAIDQWMTVAPMLKPVHAAGVAVLRGEIYVAGGYERGVNKYKESVQRYDPGENKWYICDPLPPHVSYVACTTLIIPPECDNR